PFFQTWNLFGKYPQILDDTLVGKEAQSLFNDAQILLNKIINDQSLTAKGVFGIFKANSIGDDIELLDLNTRFISLRQQSHKTASQPNIALADFIAPKGIHEDYMGCFAVTAGLGIEKILKTYEDQHDDYGSIMVKALADRLAEAAAEFLHMEVRIQY